MGLNLYDDAVESLASEDPQKGQAAVSPWDDAVGQVLGQQNTTLRLATARAKEQKPDQAAEAQKIADHFKVPPSIVQGHFDDFKQRYDADQTVETLKQAPAVANWLTKGANGAVAHDDLDKLSTLDRLLSIGRDIAGAGGAGLMDFSRGVWGAVQGAADAVNAATSRTPAAPGLLTPGNVDLYGQPKVKNADGSISTVDSFSIGVDGKEILLPTVTPDGRHLSQADAIKEFQQTGRHLGTFDTPEHATAYAEQLHNDYAAGKYDARPLAARISDFAKGSADVAASLAARARGDQSQQGFIERNALAGLEGAAAMGPALVAGATTGGLGLLATVGVTGFGQGYAEAKQQGATGGRAAAYGGLDAAIQVGTFYLPAHKLLGDLAKNAPFVTALAHQAVTAIPTMELQTALQDLNAWALLPANKERPFSDYLRERPSAAAATLVNTLAFIGASTTVGHATARMLDHAGQVVSESKTQQRAPAAVEDLIASSVKDSPAETVFLPVDTFTTYWQGKGVNPADAAKAVLGNADAYREAVRTGQDLAVPLARYLSEIAPTEHNAYFANEARFSPEAMNAREADAFQQQAKDASAPPQITETPRPDGSSHVLIATSAGKVGAEVADGTLRINHAEIGDEAQHGRGLGVQMYESMLTYAQEHGLRVTSDYTVEAPAVRVYDALARRGYRVTRDPHAYTVTLPDGSEALAAPNNQPVFTVEPPFSAAPVREHILSQLEAAGVPRSSAEQYAAIYESAFQTLGERAGIDPVDLYSRYGLKIQREGIAPPVGAELGRPLPNEGNRQPVVPQTLVDRAASDAKLLADLFVGEPLSTEGDSLAGPPSLLRMVAQVRAVAAVNPEIFGAIVRSVPIDVVNRLFGSEGAAEHALRNDPVFHDGATLDAGLAVSGRGDTEGPAGLLLGEAARQVAERSTMASRSTGDAANLGSAVRAVEGDQFPVRYSQDGLASITFGADRKFTISLGPKANLSSLIHETGHFYLEVLQDLARDPLATESFTGDLAKLHEWFGTDTIGEKEHEQFAEGFERYLQEGKAPSLELRPVFARVRAWLVGVYRTLRGQALPADVTRVFDRLLASDDAIAQVEQEGDLRSFPDAASAGMTETQFAEHQAFVADQTQKMREALHTKALRDFQREQQQWWQEERDATRATVAKELGEQPVYRALKAIREGTRPDGTPLGESTEPTPIKLSKAGLESYGPDVLKKLRSLDVYRIEGGIAPDTAAELLGYSSGDELVKALAEATPFKRAIEQETDLRMGARYGDLVRDGGLADAAQEVTHGEHRQAVVRADLKALKGQIPPAKLLNQMAAERIAATKVRDLRPGSYLMAAKRASQKAFDLLATNDRAGAVQAKQQELLSLALYREATKAQEFASAARDYLGPYFDKGATRERIGKAGGGHLEQIDGLRERFDFSRQTNKALDRRASLAAFIQSEQAQGHELAIPQDVQNEAFRTNWRELTTEELRGVFDAVKSIEHWARFKNKLLRAAEKRTLEALGADGAASIAEHAPARVVPLEPRLPGGDTKRNVQALVIAHRPLGALTRQMDGFRDGFLFDHVWRPTHEARNAEVVMSTDAAQRWTAIHDARFKGEEATLPELMHIPAIDGSLSTSARLAVAFNYGNEGNRERLRSAGIGNTGPLSEPQIQAILATLDARDWQYVKDTATLINSYREQIGTLYKRVTGVEPTWVEPTPFQTAHGEMPGWYYPISYEGRASARAAAGPEASFTEIVTKSSYMRATTANGHTEARTAHTGLPLRADLGVVGEHLQQVIHDLTHREMLIDVGRVLGRKEIQDAIYRGYGDQQYRALLGTFRDIAIGPMPAPDWYRAAEPLRRGATMARLAWSFPTMVRHLTNITNGMVRVGSGDVMKAIATSLGSAKDAEDSSGWIAAHSDLMAARWAHRYEGIGRAQEQIGLQRGKLAAQMRDAVAKVGIDPDLTQRVTDSYLYGIHKIIQMAEIPTWIAAHRQALDAHGDDPARAIASADQAVLDAFGGGDTMDLAAIQRSPAGKLLTTFMSYGLSLHRNNFEIFSKDTTIGRKIVDATLLNIVPTVLLAGIFATAKKKGYVDELENELFAHGTSMLVGVRELSNALERRDYGGPASFGIFGTAERLIYDTAKVLKGEDASGKKLAAVGKSSVELAGQFFGVPVYQVERTAAGLMALWEGKTKDPSALLFGPTKESR